MQSRIVQIEPKGTYTNASGTFNKYQIYLANGNNYQFLAKGEFKKKVGDEIDFEVTNEEYKTAKLVYTKPQTFGSGSKDQQIIRQSMVKAAASDIHTVIADAQLLINFVNNK
jgi:hypothetical protein